MHCYENSMDCGLHTVNWFVCRWQSLIEKQDGVLQPRIRTDSIVDNFIFVLQRLQDYVNLKHSFNTSSLESATFRVESFCLKYATAWRIFHLEITGISLQLSEKLKN
jgi:hypothetical protein